MEAAEADPAAGDAARGGDGGRCWCWLLLPGRGFSACAAAVIAAAARSTRVSAGPASVHRVSPRASCRGRSSAGSLAQAHHAGRLSDCSLAEAQCAGRQRCLRAACVPVPGGQASQLHDISTQGPAQHRVAGLAVLSCSVIGKECSQAVCQLCSTISCSQRQIPADTSPLRESDTQLGSTASVWQQ